MIGENDMDNDQLMLDVGQANEIKLAARRAGATNADLKRLSEGDVFAQILPVLRGFGEVMIIKHIIDCDAKPFVPDGWKVEEHIKGGQFKWDSSQIEPYLDKSQKNGKSIVGNKLRELLAGKSALNANVLDYLLANTELIPEEWKGKYIFFWGTVYRNSDGRLYVRYLYWNGDRWHWYFYWLGYGFYDDDPAALRK
jgi:hypothetical protein